MIEGTVVNSVLSPGVRVGVGAVVRDSIVMFDSVIRTGAVVDRAILDKEVVVGQGAIVGDGPFRRPPNKQEPGRLNTGITVVGKRAVIPRGVRIGRNVRVAGDVRSVGLRRPGRPQRRVRRAPAAVDARPHASMSRPGVGAPGARAVGRRRAGGRAPATPSRLATARTGFSARLRGPCHPPTPARRPCARPTSSAGSPSWASTPSSGPIARGSPPGTSCSTAAAASTSASR